MMIIDLIQAAQSLPAVLPFEAATTLWRAGLSRQNSEIGQGAGHESTDPKAGGGQSMERGVLLPNYSGDIIH